MQRFCFKCGVELNVANWSASQRARRVHKCTPCQTGESNDWQKAHRAHLREYHRKWREANPERVKELNNRSSKAFREREKAKKLAALNGPQQTT